MEVGVELLLRRLPSHLRQGLVFDASWYASPGHGFGGDAIDDASLRHFDGNNFLYADGHVKWLPISRSIEGYSITYVP